ncbi:ATP-binding protein [Roseateles asaccharophilus]|uniref:histidine kinase n=1 Tax=Roseateles asaccharophilus TaxID=582607 RepID=A0ABU2AF20_9BURK|nr:ATP-binding protein [Roseateles asaccharophilus]MDR7334578.1 signal transduction histidine kinase [Roseateles asaccharophilus]
MLVQLRLAYGAWRQESLPIHLRSGSAQDPRVDPGAVFDSLLRELSDTVRRLSFALAPPAWHDDLLAALESVAAELGLRSQLRVQLDTSELQAEGAPTMQAPLRAVVCRVVRELGLNVQKHAGASAVLIHARPLSGRLCVSVEDDGCGLAGDVASPRQSLGLRSARAQLQALGGDLTLHPRPDRGTCATLTLPFEAALADPAPVPRGPLFAKETS